MSRRPDVLVANPSPDVYGSDLQLLESVSAMRAQGWRVVVALPTDGPLVSRLTERGAEVEFVDFPVLRRANQSVGAFAGMLRDIVLAVPRLIRYVRRRSPAVVYVNTVTLPWWLLAARAAGVPAVCHLHEAEKTDSALVRRALVAPLRLARKVVVISESAMEAMVEADPGLRRKAELVYNGVPQPPTEPEPAPRSEPIRIVSVGRLSPRKAPHLALEAVAALRARGHNVHLELAGSVFEGYEWYEAELRERASRPDLAGAVTLSGYCSPIWPTLAASDILLQPSLREPFGNAVVESMYSLRPVVATAALGHLETLRDGQTGLLVPAGDVPAMTDALERLVTDAELAHTLALAARRDALSRFTTDRYVDQLAALLRGVGRL